jgi:hypothetical protein
MNKQRAPKPTNVTRWVAILAAPIPPHYGGAALSAIRQERRHAAGKLAEWGLDRNGNPKAAEGKAEG